MKKILVVVVVLAFVGCQPKDPEIGGTKLSELIKSLQDPDKKVRHDAAVAIGKLRDQAKPAVPALREALKDREGNVRSAVAHALWSIGPASGPAVPDLVPLLKDHNPNIRLNAAGAIGATGKEGGAAAGDIGAAYKKEKDARVRSVMIDAFKEIGPPAKDGVPALILALNDPDLNVRIQAAGALRAIGPGAKEAAPAIEAALKSIPTSQGPQNPSERKVGDSFETWSNFRAALAEALNAVNK